MCAQMPFTAVHFVGFIHPDQGGDARYEHAARFFGQPDFVHRRWDVRASQEIVPGDVVVFAEGTERDTPNVHAFDDSGIV
ncbi:MAG TPA: hypothetical protein VK629_05670 [Steroidobacteraceae bacterium]|nr:hypothetical protein [Steroidobacteraceae bacterium]